MGQHCFTQTGEQEGILKVSPTLVDALRPLLARRPLLGHLEAEALQLHYDVGPQAGSEFGVEAEVRREPAILEHIVGDLLFQLTQLFGALEERGVHFADADEDEVGAPAAQRHGRSRAVHSHG